MNILLLNPPDSLDMLLGKGRRFVPTFEPLGLLYIAAMCKQRGFETTVIDAAVERLRVEQVKQLIATRRPRVIGMTSFISNGEVIYHLGRWIKQEYPEITVVFGNTHAAAYAEAYLKNGCCDIVVHGEGEFVFPRIVEALRSNPDSLADIDEISFIRKGQLHRNRSVSFVEDISTLPLPDRGAVKQHLYRIPPITNAPYTGKKNSIGKHMFTSRE